MAASTRFSRHTPHENWLIWLIGRETAEAANRYREIFATGSEEVTLPYEAPWTRAVYTFT